MKQNDLDQIAAWFEQYAGSFLRGDTVTQNCLKSRYDHILRTCREMAYLTEKMMLDLTERRMAQAIALLHDVGRFEQYAHYGTFFDHVSTDHGLLGAKILGQADTLSHLSPEEQDVIQTAVKHHNRRTLPRDLPESHRRFAELIRDADKLDIFQSAIDYYHERQSNPQSPGWEIELQDEPSCSPEVLNALLSGQQIEHHHLQTIHDMQLAQLAWIYDVNFATTYQRLEDRHVLRRLIDLLPEDAPRKCIHQRVAGHISTRLAELDTIGSTV
jgi:hypothetical protein